MVRLGWSFWVGIALFLFLAANQVGASLWNLPTPMQRMDLYAGDIAMMLRGTQHPSVPIVIVAIDDDSFNYTGYHWPWPRAYLAQIVERLNQAGARVIGFDIFLLENDPDPAGDQALAAAFSGSRAVVGVMNISHSANSETLDLPVEPYRSILSGTGMAGVVADNDAIIRSVQAYAHSAFDEKNYFNWAFEVARIYQGLPLPTETGSDHLIFGDKTIPLQDGNLQIDFIGQPQSFPYYPAYQVVLGDYPAETFKDKIVLIGATTLSLQDMYPVPLSTRARMPGVEITANAINTLISGNYLFSAPLWGNLLIVLGMAAAAWGITRRRKPVWGFVVMGIAMLVLVLVWLALLNIVRWQFELASPLLMLLLGVLIPGLEQVVSETLERRRMRNLFGQFVSSEIIDQLLKTSNILSVNKRATVSIIFSDIRNFTTMSEKLTPDEVVGLLNPYLEKMTAVVQKHGGTVDKYIGDAIVAFFGEPIPYQDHARRAVRTALDMRLALVDLRATWLTEKRFEDVFEIGIGVHTGDVFVGMIGSAQRLSYTMIGDAVNTASRLQDQTKFHNCPILISEEVNTLVADEFETEFIEERLFKGKHEPVRMYKLSGYKSH